MTDSVRLRCPNLLCRTILTVPGHMRGQRVRCSVCNEPLLVPSPTPVRPAPVPPAGPPEPSRK